MPRLASRFVKLTVADRGRNVWDRYAAPNGWRQGFVALLAAGLLTGCGQSGPLTLPTRDIEDTTPPAVDEQATEEEQESGEDEE
ncbi:MAG: lipoprotein [Rhodospirillaceae bacterium]|nr:lipoprotein [Rhodospirillaceae bacterium]